MKKNLVHYLPPVFKFSDNITLSEKKVHQETHVFCKVGNRLAVDLRRYLTVLHLSFYFVNMNAGLIITVSSSPRHSFIQCVSVSLLFQKTLQ